MKRVIGIFLLVAVLFNFVSFVHAQVNSDSLLPTNQKGITIKHTYYTLSYSETDKQAEWVAYYLTPASINGLQKRSSKFLPDPLLSNPLGPNSYTKSGYDRGHLCPAADMKLNAVSMTESFYMSNMSPQVPSFNRGIWSKLEDKVRACSNRASFK
jgi:endonuclease G